MTEDFPQVSWSISVSAHFAPLLGLCSQCASYRWWIPYDVRRTSTRPICQYCSRRKIS